MSAGRSRVRRWLLEIGLLLLVFFGVRAWMTQDLAAGPTPPLNGLTLDGQPVQLAGDQPVLVHFWATWCPVCRTQEGTIDAIARDHRVITVALQSGEAAELRHHLEAEGLSLTVIPDPEGRIAAAWGVTGVPASFVVRDGTIRFREKGYTSGPGLRARLWLASVLD